jgi:5-oxoprolinase (ATP-hydrolysing) subunit A
MINSKTIDINCDLGEGDNATDCDHDRSLMPYLSRCNIACGGHAGNQQTMTLSLKNAKQFQLQAGAHPSYPDRNNFGRVSLKLAFNELAKSLIAQIKSLQSIAQSEEVLLTHIKFHGALYNDIENDEVLAKNIAHFCQSHYPNLSVLGLTNGWLHKYCQQLNLKFIAEGFMDRRYKNNGKLSPRSAPGSVIKNTEKAIQQAIALAKGDPIKSIEGDELTLKVDSICLHGDNPNANAIAEQLISAFKQQQIQVFNQPAI